MAMSDVKRCRWADTPLLIAYHDHEWGTPPQSNEGWFEFVVLEMFQAGLSWKTILHKREAFRHAFSGFQVDAVAAYGPNDVARLLSDAGIVRNRGKIEAAIENARIAQQIIRESGSLGAFFASLKAEPVFMLDTLQKTFRRVGKTTAESIVYATGLLPPPHEPGCWLYRQSDA